MNDENSPVDVWLIKNAKTISELNPRGKDQYCRGCYKKERECLECFWNTEKWVSVPKIQVRMGKLEKELNEANLLCELQASRISGLETFKKQCSDKPK